MTGWIVLGVIGGLILLSAVVLMSSVVAKIEYCGDFALRIKFWGITVFDTGKLHRYVNRFEKFQRKRAWKNSRKIKRQVTKEKKRVEKAAKRGKPSKKPQPDMKKNQSLIARIAEESGLAQVTEDIKDANKRSFDFEMLKLFYDSMFSPLKRIVGKIRVTGLQLNCVVGGSDAMKIALSYGLQSAAISSGLEWLNTILVLRAKQISVTADFAAEKTSLTMKCTVKIRIGVAVFYVLKVSVKTLSAFRAGSARPKGES
jgi:hypothetical protein